MPPSSTRLRRWGAGDCPGEANASEEQNRRPENETIVTKEESSPQAVTHLTVPLFHLVMMSNVLSSAGVQTSLLDETPAQDVVPRQMLRAEANLLRFPLFALHTKGLKQRDGIVCVGRQADAAGKLHEFKLSITRNTAHFYPGPLSRRVHFALLSFLHDQGHPFHNPITWEWRALIRRMGLQPGGQIVNQLKDAIVRTHGIVITTNYALKSKDASGKTPLPKRERGYHLYSSYSFINEELPDGTIADCNSVHLADWYLANLNAMYCGPVDYGLWKLLENQSPIAIRLYEYLLFNFTAGKSLRINYPTLAQFLPVRP